MFNLRYIFRTWNMFLGVIGSLSEILNLKNLKTCFMIKVCIYKIKVLSYSLFFKLREKFFEHLPSIASIVLITSVFSTDGCQSYFWYLSPDLSSASALDDIFLPSFSMTKNTELWYLLIFIFIMNFILIKNYHYLDRRRTFY